MEWGLRFFVGLRMTGEGPLKRFDKLRVSGFGMQTQGEVTSPLRYGRRPKVGLVVRGERWYVVWNVGCWSGALDSSWDSE